MKIGIIVVTFSLIPEKLINSIEGKTAHKCRWYIHHHGNNQSLVNPLLSFSNKLDSKIYLHMFNRGLARTWNDGIGESFDDDNDFTIVINDDIQFIDDGFDLFIDFLLSCGPDITVGFLLGKEGPNSYLSGEINCQEFACFCIGRKAIETVGYFDENLVPAYYEDTDYSIRLQKSGLKPFVDERVLVIHDRNQTTRSFDADSRYNFEKCKTLNHNYFVKKWGTEYNIGNSYSHPFSDKSLNLDIPWKTRHRPYGLGYDRDDLEMIRLLTS